ncbi:S-adenosyl-L-methionine-dependent methyltransferase [Phycomyces nitens]|nr:S-adenosyl-L-methionine-dependent methyltransferase [Phycomyces nitens]
MELDKHRSTFLNVYTEADIKCQDTSDTDPFPAYLEGIDTTLAPFCPTSANRVLQALEMAKVGRDDRLLDLGSGDGRFCTAAVAVCGAAHAMGIESDSGLVDLSKSLCRQVLGDTLQVEFIEGDLLGLPGLVRDPKWTVIVLFLLPDHTDKFADLLRYHHDRGARIVSLVFNLNEIQGLSLKVSDEPQGIYVYEKPIV